MPLRTALRLPRDLVDALDALAKRTGQARSELIRTALRSYVVEQERVATMTETIEEKGRDLGLFHSGVLTRVDAKARPSEFGPTRPRSGGRTTLPFRLLGMPVVIDPTAPPLERDRQGNIILPGGHWANYCEACGKHYATHDEGECPKDA